MPSEAVIARMIDIFTEVIDLGGVEERTAIVPNLSVIDAAPTGLTNFIIVQDDRDGDNILAKTVPGVVYANNDKVNVLFVKGTEPIAFQQGSESSSSGIWGIVPSTSTDIFYNDGDVGIGKSVAPNASLEILDTAQAQLRLTHTEDTKFVDFTLGTNHNLTIDPSSTGQIKLAADVTVTNKIIHEGDTDNEIAFTDDVQTYTIGGEVLLTLTEAAQDVVKIGDGGDVDINFNDDMFLEGSNSNFAIGTTDTSFVVNGTTVNTRLFIESPDEANFHGFTLLKVSDTAGRATVVDIVRARVGPAAVVDNDTLGAMQFFGHDGTDFIRSAAIQVNVNGAVAANTMPGELIFQTSTGASLISRMRITSNGDISIGNIATPLAKLHIDQASTTAAIPVTLFDQADVSEEMFEFVSTIGVGNAIEAVGAKTLTVTHFIKVTIPGGLTRYFQVGTIA